MGALSLTETVIIFFDALERMDKIDLVSQVAIFVGALSVLFLGKGNRWGFVLGLVVQPFWYYTAIKHQQWGLVAASVIYTYGWMEGVHRTFIKNQPVTKKEAAE